VSPGTGQRCKNQVASREGLIVGGSRIKTEQAVDGLLHLGSGMSQKPPILVKNPGRGLYGAVYVNTG
jgi:hypothetical protein